MTTYRKAELKDVPALFRLIQHYAAERRMLPRPPADLSASFPEFTVVEQEGQVVACGSLKLYDNRVAEIRSLCVAPGNQSRGLGRGLAERLLREAQSFGLETVFALTAAPGFFRKCGFREVARENFPAKIQRDCLSCEFYPACREKTMAIKVGAPRPRPFFRRLPTELPALRPA